MVTNIVTNIFLNTKIKEVKNKISNIINLVTTTNFTAENKIPNVSNLVKKKLTIAQKLMKFKTEVLTMIKINLLIHKDLIS